jgi:hypothetical protein
VQIKLYVLRRRGGWCIAGSPEEEVDGRPYRDRLEAMRDALFAARLLANIGDETAVFIENDDGFRLVPDEDVLVWTTH